MALISQRNPYKAELALLEDVGIVKKSDRKIEEVFLDEMDSAGLTPSAILGTVNSIMQGGESDGVKLSAAREALKLYMHPAFVEQRKVADAVQNQQIIFNISGENVQMNNVLRPKDNEVKIIEGNA